MEFGHEPDLVQAVPSSARVRQGARTGFLAVLLAILGSLVFFFYNFQTVVVSGKSMVPTLHDKQRILICKAIWLVGRPKVNDIIVVKLDDGEFVVKRVFRTEGQNVDISLSPLGWDYFAKGQFKVPQGMLYVLGDNLQHSEDSRMFGPVSESRVVGKLIWR
jgi:signal peptidase I